MANGSPLRHNIIANFSGKIFIAIISIAFVPFYIRFLGIESYGVIGIYVSVSALLAMLDLGLSTTLSRELARLAALPGSERESRDLIRTLEIVYWSMGLVAGLVVTLSAPLVVRHWIRPLSIPPETVVSCIEAMGAVFALQWPASLYAGGLIGIQRQIPLNAIRSAMAAVQHGGAVLVLWLISPTVIAYFAWQAFSGVVQTLLLAGALWRRMPETDTRPAFRTGLMVQRWHFAAGVTGISLAATVLTQADKVILSRILSLDHFGYYMLAYNISNSVIQLASPVFLTLFPKFSEMSALSAQDALSDLYHKGCQLVSALMVPATLILAIFPGEILSLWIGDAQTVENTRNILALMMIGTMLNGFMMIPFALQLACGWTMISFYKNLIAIVVCIPLLVLLASAYGAIGGAVVWIVLNAGYFLFEIPIMHSRLLKGELRRWYARDVGIPLIAVLAIMGSSRLVIPADLSPLHTLLWLCLTGLLSVLCAGLGPAIRYYKDVRVIIA